MVKLIPGKRGSGKTKLLIEKILAAKASSNGNVVAIQVGNSLNSEINHGVRLINIEDYRIVDCGAMYGFTCGIMASDYDCTHIFIDGILKIVGRDMDEIAKMLDTINKISDKSTEVTLTFSADVNEIPENIKKYL